MHRYSLNSNSRGKFSSYSMRRLWSINSPQHSDGRYSISSGDQKMNIDDVVMHNSG